MGEDPLYLTADLQLTEEVQHAAEFILMSKNNSMIQNNSVQLSDNNIFGCLVCIKLVQSGNTNSNSKYHPPELYISTHKTNGIALVTIEEFGTQLSNNSIQYTADSTILWDIFPDDVSQLKHDFIPEFLDSDDLLNFVFA